MITSRHDRDALAADPDGFGSEDDGVADGGLKIVPGGAYNPLRRYARGATQKWARYGLRSVKDGS